jgi:hypothetical protein
MNTPGVVDVAVFEKRLQHLLDTRQELIPFHVMNIEPLASWVKQWEIVSTFKLLCLQKEDSTLCVEDTLGIMSYLLLPFCRVTWNRLQGDHWDFIEQPDNKLIMDLAHLPPKHSVFYSKKYTRIILLSLLDLDCRRRSPSLFAAHRLLAPGGKIVLSFTTSKSGDQCGRLHPISPEAWAKLLSDHSFIEEASEELPPDLADRISGSMRVVQVRIK